jgi:hypothetical protein
MAKVNYKYGKESDLPSYSEGSVYFCTDGANKIFADLGQNRIQLFSKGVYIEEPQELLDDVAVNYVSFASQYLTDAQKAQVQENIGVDLNWINL